MVLSLKGYVKASANMKTTKKKVMINLKNQFETMYEMNSRVRNMDAYVDRYLLKLRFLGITYSGWEKLPYLSAGTTAIIMAAGIYYGYLIKASDVYYAEILFATAITLACLFVFFHIFGIKARKQQIHIQLVDYLENYLANRLIKNADNKDDWEKIENEIDEAYIEGKREAFNEANETADDHNATADDTNKKSSMDEDMDMLKRLIREIDAGKNVDKAAGEVAASDEVAAADEDQSDIELLEEFVQSFLS